MFWPNVARLSDNLDNLLPLFISPYLLCTVYVYRFISLPLHLLCVRVCVCVCVCVCLCCFLSLPPALFYLCVCVRALVLCVVNKDLLKSLTPCAFHCRYVTELPGGEQYVSCSVVLPALCHLFRVMEPSDNDPVYFLRIKKAFTIDLAQRKDSTNLKWLKITTALDPKFKDLKCLPKYERSEVWASVRDLMMTETHAQQPPAETTEELSPKKRRTSILLGSSDSDTDDEEESIEHCLARYKAEPKMDIEGGSTTMMVKERGSTCQAGTHCTQVPVNPCNHSAL